MLSDELVPFQTSHQQCHTLLPLWQSRGESHVKPVSATVWGTIFMTTNLTGLQPLWLFCVLAVWRMGCFREISTEFQNWKLPSDQKLKPFV
jgi:hypothetical protein